jgi:hypothetical protein
MTLCAYSPGRVLTGGHYPRIPFKSLICCELMSMDKETGKKAGALLGGGAVNRRDVWPSREEAYKVFKSRGTWKSWDDRVLRNYVVRMGPVCDLRCISSAPAGDRPQAHERGRQWDWGDTQMSENPRISVLLTGPVKGPALTHASKGVLPGFDGLVESLQLLAGIREASTHPSDLWGYRRLHVSIFPLPQGSTLTCDRPGYVKKDILRRVGGAQSLGSFARVPNAGHLVSASSFVSREPSAHLDLKLPQMNPHGLAKEIYAALMLDCTSQPLAKL